MCLWESVWEFPNCTGLAGILASLPYNPENPLAAKTILELAQFAVGVESDLDQYLLETY